MDRVIYRDDIVNQRFFIYCSLASQFCVVFLAFVPLSWFFFSLDGDLQKKKKKI